MTIFLLTLFYCYSQLALFYYKREQAYRAIKIKTQTSLKRSAFICVITFLANLILSLIFGTDLTVLVNLIPCVIMLLLMNREKRKIIRYDRGEENVLHREKRYLGIFKRR